MPEAAASSSRITRLILRIILVASVVGLAIWQYQIVSGGKKQVRQGATAEELRFKLVNGREVGLPDEDSDKFTVLIFWSSESGRSMKLLADAVELAQEPEVDSTLQFYFVNLNEDLDRIEESVDTEKLANVVGYDPSGDFMYEHQIRALPLTLVFSRKGNMIDKIEGYEEEQLKANVNRWVQTFRATGPDAEINFEL